MHKHIAAIILCLITALDIAAVNPDSKAGTIVSQKIISDAGTDSWFTVCEIDSTLFSRIYGLSFAEECTTPRDDLRYIRILHHDGNSNIRIGEMICHKTIAADLIEIFRSLYEARYPIERMVLIDDYGADDQRSMTANNSSAFNFRFISGTRKLSNHSRGLAVDINPLYNPYVRKKPGGRISVEPASARRFADRSAGFPFKITRGDICYNEFIKHGFTWGGDWKNSKDYQHFEKKIRPHNP